MATGKRMEGGKEGAPITTLRLMSDGKCDYITMKDVWSFAGGNMKIGDDDLAVEYPCVKVDDLSFTLYVKPSDKTYTHKFVKNL